MKDAYESEDGSEDPNYSAFRDCFFSTLIGASATPSRGKGRSGNARSTIRSSLPPTTSATHTSGLANDPSELAEFSDFIAYEIFPSLPNDLRTLSYQISQENAEIAEKWSLPVSLSVMEELADLVPPSAADSLSAYGLIEPPKSDVQSFLSPVITNYIAAVVTPPPKWVSTRATACEICEREWVPLTYHHLIPKGVHAKVLKRGWHSEQMLNSVAWLCRACHTFVHKMASNEELAREWFTVEKICSREDTQKWAQWVGKVRWKKT